MSTIVTRSGKGSALSHTEMDANFTNLNTDKLENLLEDTSPQLGGTLDTNDKAIGNAGAAGFVDFEKRIQIDENIADYSITVDNQNEQGLGLRIKAGDKDYVGSLAILSVADKNNTQQFIVKANGDVNAAETMTVGRAGTDSGTQGIISMVPGAISTLNTSDDLNITTNSGVLSLNSLSFPGSDGTTGQVLTTNGSGALSFADNTLLQDTSPQLGGALDQNGQKISDDTRNYQILGDQATPSSANYDSFNNTARVFGPVTISEVDGPSNRVHSNPRLTLVKADASVSGGSNAGRLRMNYIEGVYEMDGFDNTCTGFGRGHNGFFVSSMAKNSNASNNASTLAEQTGMTITPQVQSDSTGGLTVTDLRCIDMNPNINDTNGTVTTLYGLYYNTSNAGTITTQYSFYGAEPTASAYNDGGFQLPIVTVANLSTLAQREGNTAYVNNNTAGTGSVAKCQVFYDGSNWKLAHEPGTTAA